MPPPLQTYIPRIYARREYTDGLLQELGILRAEQGGVIYASAPTDHHRKNLCIIPEVCCKNSDGLLRDQRWGLNPLGVQVRAGYCIAVPKFQAREPSVQVSSSQFT